MSTIYTGIFFDNGTHMTIQFRPTDEQVSDTPIGDTVEVTVTGIVRTDEVTAVTVDSPIEVASGVPHITISTAEGVSPVRSIGVIREVGVTSIEPYTITGRVGRFTGRGVNYS